MATAGASVFIFQLSVKPNFSFFEVFRLSFPQLALMFYQLRRGYNQFRRDSGVCHGDDVLYIFPFEGLPPAVETEVIIIIILLCCSAYSAWPLSMISDSE